MGADGGGGFVQPRKVHRWVVYPPRTVVEVVPAEGNEDAWVTFFDGMSGERMGISIRLDLFRDLLAQMRKADISL